MGETVNKGTCVKEAEATEEGKQGKEEDTKTK
jgi:hypothetical protein